MIPYVLFNSLLFYIVEKSKLRKTLELVVVSKLLNGSVFGERPSPYYAKNRSNKQRETTIHHYFKT